MEPRDIACEAGLRYVEDGSDGYRRVRRGQGFSYHTVDGALVHREVRDWISSLAIPPAWRQVWIADSRDCHILATGIDDAGRKQYIYHPLWNEARDAVKFDQLGIFGRRLGLLRRKVDADLGPDAPARRRACALAVAILDRSLVRVGNAEYLDANESYGLTTMSPDHVTVESDRITFDFVGKAGAEHFVSFQEATLARLLEQSLRLEGDTALAYDDAGIVRSLTSDQVNEYLRSALGHPITAKTFRTWGATRSVAETLSAESNGEPGERRILAAMDAAAEQLGNTREVCRSSYVHPAVPEAYLDGRLAQAWRRSRTGRWLDRAESTVNRVIAQV